MFNRISQIRNNIRIRKRLTTLILVIGLLIVSYGVVMIQNVAQADKKIHEINDIYLKNMVNLSELVENLYSVLLENYILNENSLDPNSVNASINMDLINTTIGSYSSSITDETQRVLFDNFSLELYNYIAVLKDINVLKLSGQFELANQSRLSEEIKAFRKMQANVKNLINYNTNAIQENNAIIRKIEKNSLIKTYVFSIILFLISVVSVLLLIKDISPSIQNLTKNLIILSKGEIPKNKVSESNNEIGLIAKLINKLTGNLSQLNQFALTLNKGNYSSKYELSGSDDFIGKALVDLRDSLKHAQDQNEARKIEEERRNWTNKGHAIFSEILRQRAGGISHLTDNIIKNLVHYLDANQGGLFLINDSQKGHKIELVSAFAYDRKKFFDKEINLGDGLIGTVALERNTIYLKEIPEDYIEIESGLGDANPNSLLIVPLKFEEEILGVVEIASFKDFKDFEITFVEELAQSIASSLLTAKINAQTEQLLEDSEKKSEELAAQEIEMRQNMEEMRATQELAQRREADLSGILSAVDNTLMKGEYNIDGTLLSVNNRHLQTMGYQLSEIKGKNIEIFIPHDELEEFRKIWETVVEGNSRQIEVERKTKSGDLIWLINQYTPVQDEKGTISKVLYLAHDITEYKKSETDALSKKQEIKSKEIELTESIKNLESAKSNITRQSTEITGIFDAINTNLLVIEFDMEGNIIKVNQNFLTLFKKEKNEMLGHKMNECVSIVRTGVEYKNLWDELIAGNSKKMITQFTFEDGNNIWVDETYTPILGADNKPYKILNISVDISQLKLAEEKNAVLLKETQEYSNILHEKDKEMQDAIKDLLSQEENLALSMKNYKDISDSLNQIYPGIEIDQNYKMVHSNDLFNQFSGFSFDELKSKNFLELTSDESETEIKSVINKAFTNKTETINSEIKNKNGEIKTVQITLIPISDKDKKVLKLQIFMLNLSGFRFGTNALEGQQELIELKKKELADIQKEIIKTQRTKQKEVEYIPLDEKEDKLYNQWLFNIKKQLR
ncbi:MAG: PAS domain S-box protein [Bacteroidota bacterium]